MDAASKRGKLPARIEIEKELPSGENSTKRRAQRSFDDFMAHDYPKPANLVEPWLPESGIVELDGARGTGKSWIALGLAMAVSCGATFLEWKTRPASVLYVDAEMPAGLQQKRAEALMAGQKLKPGKLAILNHADLGRGGMPDLSKPANWVMMHNEAAGHKLVIVDNLSSVQQSGSESDDDAWITFAQQLMTMRRREITVILIHHLGKNLELGGRGTSRRQDIMDTVVELRAGKKGGKNETLVTWKFTKHRAFIPDPDEHEIEIKISTQAPGVTTIERDHSMRAELEEFAAVNAGKSVRQIARESGMSKSAVGRRMIGAKRLPRPTEGYK